MVLFEFLYVYATGVSLVTGFLPERAACYGHPSWHATEASSCGWITLGGHSVRRRESKSTGQRKDGKSWRSGRTGRAILLVFFHGGNNSSYPIYDKIEWKGTQSKSKWCDKN